MTGVLPIFALCLMSFARSGAWVNEYDKPATFQCPRRQFISNIVSEHHDYYEDRLWDFKCSKLESLTSCVFTDYVNDFRQKINFECPEGSAITGVDSYHEDKHEDRRFRFKCCNKNRASLPLTNCRQTDWLNAYDKKVDFNVPANTLITGLYSEYDTYYQDRRFKVKVCNY